MTSPRSIHLEPHTSNPSAEAGLAFADYFKTSAAGPGPGPGPTSPSSYHHNPLPVQRPHGLAARSVSGGSATGALPLSQLLSTGSAAQHLHGHHHHAGRTNGSMEADERRPSVQGYSYSNLVRNYETPSAHTHATPSTMHASGSGRLSPFESASERRAPAYDEDSRSSYAYARHERGPSPQHQHLHHHHRQQQQQQQQQQHQPHSSRRTERQGSLTVRPFLTSPAESLEVYGGTIDYAREDHFPSLRGGRYYADERVSPPTNAGASSIRGHRDYDYDRDRARRESDSVFGPMPTGRTAGRPLPPTITAAHSTSNAEYDRDREYRAHAPLNGHAYAPRDHPVMLEREEIIKAKRARLNELVKWEARRRAGPGTPLSNGGGERTFYGYKRERGRSSISAEPGQESKEVVPASNGSVEPIRRTEEDLPRLIRGDSYGAISNHLPAGIALSRPQSRTGSVHDHPIRLGSIMSEPREDYRTLSGPPSHPDRYGSMSPLPEPTVLPAPPSLSMPSYAASVDQDATLNEQPVLAKKQKIRIRGRPKNNTQPAPLLEHRELGYTGDEDADLDDDLMHLIPGDAGDEDEDMDGLDNEDDSADGPKKSRRRNKDQNKEMSPETKQRWERESWPTKGLVNKDGSLRRKPGPPKGIPKVKKASTRKSEAGLNGGDGGDIRQQALLNASGLGEPEDSVHDDPVSEDGTPMPLPAVETPPKKKGKRTKKPIVSQPVSRASSPAADLASEADSQFAAELDHDLEDMLGGTKPSKGKRKARDVGLFDTVSRGSCVVFLPTDLTPLRLVVLGP